MGLTIDSKNQQITDTSGNTYKMIKYHNPEGVEIELKDIHDYTDSQTFSMMWYSTMDDNCIEIGGEVSEKFTMTLILDGLQEFILEQVE